MTPRDELHQFIDDLDDEIIGPALHTLVETLPDELVPQALRRMRFLRDRLTESSVQANT